MVAYRTQLHVARDDTRGRDNDMTFIARLRALRHDAAGQDLLEYALLIALIALAVRWVMSATTGAHAPFRGYAV